MTHLHYQGREMSGVSPTSEQQATTTRLRTASLGSGTLPKSCSRDPLTTVFEKQGVKQIRPSPPSSRPKVKIPVYRDPMASGPPPNSEPLEPSASETTVIRHSRDMGTMTAPPNSKLKQPPIPDFDKPPYAKPIGCVFAGDEWDPLVNRLDDKVIKFLVACEMLATFLNLPVDRLGRTGLHYNIMELDEQTIMDITRDCWWIMYEVITDGLRWTDILNKKRSLLERLKRNIRQSQPHTRWDVPCDVLISLGCTQPWLYERT